MRVDAIWDRIDDGRHIGYRRGLHGSSWFARMWVGAKGTKYRQMFLGEADDVHKANGADVLDHKQAVNKAKSWWTDADTHGVQARGSNKGKGQDRTINVAPAPPYTVAHAAKDYLEWFKANRSTYETTSRQIWNEILVYLAPIPIESLQTRVIRQWLDRIAERPHQMPWRYDEGRRYRPKPTDPDAIRRRRVTANGALAVLKAILNRAYEHGYIDSDLQWRRVKKFRNVDPPPRKVLEASELRHLISFCDADMRTLVEGAVLTGCRISELVGLRVGDFDKKTKRLIVRTAKTGHYRTIALSGEGQDLLMRLSKRRRPTSTMFTRRDGLPWNKNTYARVFRKTVEKAGFERPMGFHTLRHTYASHAIMAGIPLTIVAKQLGHKDTKMVEHCYGHIIPSYVDDIVFRMFPALLSGNPDSAVEA